MQIIKCIYGVYTENLSFILSAAVTLESWVRNPQSAFVRFSMKTFAVLYFSIVCLRFIHVNSLYTMQKKDESWIYRENLREGIEMYNTLWHTFAYVIWYMYNIVWYATMSRNIVIRCISWFNIILYLDIFQFYIVWYFMSYDKILYSIIRYNCSTYLYFIAVNW